MHSAFVRRYSACLLSTSILGFIGIATPAIAACTTTGTTVVCDANRPNPSNGAFGENIHLLAGSIVEITDPYAYASPATRSVVVFANGTLTADAGSLVLDPVIGDTGVEGGPASTLSIAGTVRAQHDNSRAVVLDQGASLSVAKGGLIETTGNGGPFLNKSAAIAIAGDGATVDIGGTVRTSGENASAIVGGVNDPIGGSLRFHEAAITIESGGAISTSGGNSHAVRIGSGTLTNYGRIATTGVGSHAVWQSSTGAIVNDGVITTSGDGAIGIYVTDPDAVSISGSGSVSTTGDNAQGVNAQSSEGDISIRAGRISTAGNSSDAILAEAANGAVSVFADSATASGAGSHAIMARGSGSVLVTSGTAAAADTAAISATSTGGDAAVTLNGATSTGTGASVIITGATTATLTLGQGGSLTSVGGGAKLSSADGAFVNNDGAIEGEAAPIISAAGGPLTFNNSGTFAGVIAFPNGGNVVNNSGTYRALYDQDFGSGTFNNSGLLAVLSGAAAARTVAFTGLTSLNNSGLVDLRNGHAGDVLALSGNFAGSGNSSLGIDVVYGAAGSAPSSDQLRVSGAITGSTKLVIQPIGGGSPGLNSSIVFATGGAGSSADAFSIASGSTEGFLHYGISFDSASNSYSLALAPGQALFETLKINEGTEQLWYKSADTWSAHMNDLRDARFAGNQGGRLWGQFYGQSNTRDARRSGQVQEGDLSYRQDAFGGQLGFDLARTDGKSVTAFGLTGGYASSNLDFRASADHVRYDAANIGIYAGFSSGGVFANVLGKYDYYWISSNSPLAGYNARFHGMGYGIQGEAGYRFGSQYFYAEPIVALAYVRTDLRTLRALGSAIDFDNMDGLRGKAGLRIGSRSDIGGGATLLLYAQGNYVHEFKGDDGITFINGGQKLTYRNRPIADYGEGKIGFSVISTNGLTGFIEGFGDGSRNYKGGGGRVGLRVNF